MSLSLQLPVPGWSIVIGDFAYLLHSVSNGSGLRLSLVLANHRATVEGRDKIGRHVWASTAVAEAAAAAAEAAKAAAAEGKRQKRQRAAVAAFKEEQKLASDRRAQEAAREATVAEQRRQSRRRENGARVTYARRQTVEFVAQTWKLQVAVNAALLLWGTSTTGGLKNMLKRD